MSEYMTIAQVAARSGFSVPTLRFYEKEGVIPRIPRDAAGNRLYGEAELARVDAIRCLRAAGLSLQDLKKYFSMVEEGPETLGKRRQLLLDARENLRHQLAELQKCMLYLARKIAYYDIACEAAAEGEPLPVFESGAFRAIFAEEDISALAAASRPDSENACPAPRKG